MNPGRLNRAVTTDVGGDKMEAVITERGWPGHFICARDCMFRRNTLIEYGESRVVVSTVGNMRRQSDGALDTIGEFGRTFETMAFGAKWDRGYWDTNVYVEVEFYSNWALKGHHQLSDAAANRMHDRVVAEIAGSMS